MLRMRGGEENDAEESGDSDGDASKGTEAEDDEEIEVDEEANSVSHGQQQMAPAYHRYDYDFGFTGCDGEGDYACADILTAGASADGAPPAVASVLHEAARLMSVIRQNARRHELADGLPNAVTDDEAACEQGWTTWGAHRHGGVAPRGQLAKIAARKSAPPLKDPTKAIPEPYYQDEYDEEGDEDDDEEEDNVAGSAMTQLAGVLTSLWPYSQSLIVGLLRCTGQLDAQSVLSLLDACGTRPDVIDALLWPLVCKAAYVQRRPSAYPSVVSELRPPLYLLTMICVLHGLACSQRGTDPQAQEAYNWLVEPVVAKAHVSMSSLLRASKWLGQLCSALVSGGRSDEVCGIVGHSTHTILSCLHIFEDIITAVLTSGPQLQGQAATGDGVLAASSSSSSAAPAVGASSAVADGVMTLLSNALLTGGSGIGPNGTIAVLQRACDVASQLPEGPRSRLLAWVSATGSSWLAGQARGVLPFDAIQKLAAFLPAAALTDAITQASTGTSGGDISSIYASLQTPASVAAFRALATSSTTGSALAAAYTAACARAVGLSASGGSSAAPLAEMRSCSELVQLLHVHGVLGDLMPSCSSETQARYSQVTVRLLNILSAQQPPSSAASPWIAVRDTSHVSSIVAWVGKNADAATSGGSAGRSTRLTAWAAAVTSAAAAEVLYPRDVLLAWARSTLLLQQPGPVKVNDAAVASLRAGSRGTAAAIAALTGALAEHELTRLAPLLSAASGGGSSGLVSWACTPDAVASFCAEGCEKASGQGEGTCDGVRAFLLSPTREAVTLHYKAKAKCHHVYVQLRKAANILGIMLSPESEDGKAFTITKDWQQLAKKADAAGAALRKAEGVARALRRAADLLDVQ